MKTAFENKHQQNEALRAFEAGAPAINKVIEQWNLLDVGQIDDQLLNELTRTNDVGAIVRRGLMASFQESDLRIAGRQVTRETMAEIVAPMDLTGLSMAVAEAGVHFFAFEAGSIIKGKFQLDPAKVEELKKRYSVMTNDLKTLEAAQQIIKSLQVLFDSGKRHPDHTLHHLFKAGIIDDFITDGLQPNRSLFTQNN